MLPLRNSQEIPNSFLDPNWKEIIKEIGKQLNSRKHLLFKRTFLIVWPGFIILALFIILGQWENISNFLKLNPAQSGLYSFSLFII